jgi:hypothetical protein
MPRSRRTYFRHSATSTVQSTLANRIFGLTSTGYLQKKVRRQMYSLKEKKKLPENSFRKRARHTFLPAADEQVYRSVDQEQLNKKLTDIFDGRGLLTERQYQLSYSLGTARTLKQTVRFQGGTTTTTTTFTANYYFYCETALETNVKRTPSLAQVQ